MELGSASTPPQGDDAPPFSAHLARAQLPDPLQLGPLDPVDDPLADRSPSVDLPTDNIIDHVLDEVLGTSPPPSNEVVPAFTDSPVTSRGTSSPMPCLIRNPTNLTLPDGVMDDLTLYNLNFCKNPFVGHPVSLLAPNEALYIPNHFADPIPIPNFDLAPNSFANNLKADHDRFVNMSYAMDQDPAIASYVGAIRVPPSAVFGSVATTHFSTSGNAKVPNQASRAGPSRAGPSRAGPSSAGPSRAGPSSAEPSTEVKKEQLVQQLSDIGKRLHRKKTPSRFCHICVRSAERYGPVVCSNNETNGCRKVVCKRCFDEHKWDWEAAMNDDDWKCCHCRNACPEKASCFTYNRSNKRRMPRRENDNPASKRPRAGTNGSA